jgi:hypothetical protein
LVTQNAHFLTTELWHEHDHVFNLESKLCKQNQVLNHQLLAKHISKRKNGNIVVVSCSSFLFFFACAKKIFCYYSFGGLCIYLRWQGKTSSVRLFVVAIHAYCFLSHVLFFCSVWLQISLQTTSSLLLEELVPVLI